MLIELIGLGHVNATELHDFKNVIPMLLLDELDIHLEFWFSNIFKFRL